MAAGLMPRRPGTAACQVAAALAAGFLFAACHANLQAAVASFPSGPIPEAVRSERWEDVRTYTARIPNPSSPALALAVARAARGTGDPERALEVSRNALADAGDLSAALRLEAAAALLELGRDPWPMVQPLLARRAPAAHRRAATELLQRGWVSLPIELLTRHQQRPLSPPLTRRLEGILAARTGDSALARRLLRDNDRDAVATDLCLSLVSGPGLEGVDPLHCASGLLVGGRWRAAQTLLEQLNEPEQPDRLYRHLFLKGRAAYRLGQRNAAASLFERAVEAATDEEERFAAAVQRARVAELDRDRAKALNFWRIARTAKADRWEGWDGEARSLVALDRTQEAVAGLDQIPLRQRNEVASRLAAVLLAREKLETAQKVIRLLRPPSPEKAVLELALQHRQGREDLSPRIAAVLADPRAGRWREMAAPLPTTPADSGSPPPATRDLDELARIAATFGVDTARDSLLRALAADPEWARLIAGSVLEPESLDQIIRELGSVGLESEAARLYPHLFPGRTPAEQAWSARALAAWGNAPAALSRGERVWASLGPLPAVLLPEAVLRLVLPEELVESVARAAAPHGVSPALLVAVIRQESRFETAARSRAGALGVAQFMPETARSLGADLEDLMDASTALGLAAKELSRLHRAMGEPAVLAAGSYNAGETMVRNWLQDLGDNRDEILFALLVPFGETSRYVLAVREGMELARHLR
jgi:tetratricopeptide (TPR) repeat protein